MSAATTFSICYPLKSLHLTLVLHAQIPSFASGPVPEPGEGPSPGKELQLTHIIQFDLMLLASKSLLKCSLPSWPQRNQDLDLLYLHRPRALLPGQRTRHSHTKPKAQILLPFHPSPPSSQPWTRSCITRAKMGIWHRNLKLLVNESLRAGEGQLLQPWWRVEDIGTCVELRL